MVGAHAGLARAQVTEAKPMVLREWGCQELGSGRTPLVTGAVSWEGTLRLASFSSVVTCRPQ